jgi:REP element-mobilizing transposase RayT
MPEQSRRRNRMRHPDFDYSADGAYFVTVVTQGRAPMFGKIVDNALSLNDQGMMVERWWMALPSRFPSAAIGRFVVMPNHLHGIVALTGAATRGRPYDERDAATLGSIVRWFKTMTTNAYIRDVRDSGWPPFDERLWKRNYYDCVIRDAAE